ncbi:2-oxo-4-hydroxy-4-carboxy-5-ureidoimidazoline decarboxylase [Streptomyces sp. 4N509B]|uniref:2-oxo-4-hydroxy-4-carboxy-5-ureidoimidazoline decarboxylase n=1 Tax=Streptomyces sp. 4N509B TaxID=3457413 RepID=UPI003FD06F37
MNDASLPQAGLAWLNAAEEGAARRALRRVCASHAWADALLAARPFPDAGALLAANDAATAALTPADLAEALAAHPPIGRPTPGDATSAREQRGMADAPTALRERMAELNLAYQERFGHVFLIRATGLTGEQMHDALSRRLGHTPEQERETVRTELAGINGLRLRRLAAAPTVSTHILDTSVGRPVPDVPVALSVRATAEGPWSDHAAGTTDTDGRCRAFPPLPDGTAHARLTFDVAPHLGRDRAGASFFPEVTVAFAPAPGEHHHVPLLLTPYGYSVYRGS